jgi:hypothetical protein
MEDVGPFYGLLLYFMDIGFVVIWYIFPVLVFCAKKNLATLVYTNHFDSAWVQDFFLFPQKLLSVF